MAFVYKVENKMVQGYDLCQNLCWFFFFFFERIAFIAPARTPWRLNSTKQLLQINYDLLVPRNFIGREIVIHIYLSHRNRSIENIGSYKTGLRGINSEDLTNICFAGVFVFLGHT